MSISCWAKGGVGAAAFAGLSVTAHAHSLGPGVNEFWAGVIHPAIAFDQAVGIIGLGLVLARFDRDDERPFFPIALAFLTVGMTIGGFFLRPYAQTTIAVALMAIGLTLLNLNGVVMRYPQTILAVYGAVLGMAFGAEIPEDAGAVLFCVGLSATTTIAAGYTILAWQKLHRPWFDIAVRIAGSWLIAIGLMVLGLALRPGDISPGATP